MDHFFRRRNQAEWDLILGDMAWCEAFLGDEFRAMLPEGTWLDLELDRSLLGMGGALALDVRNRSDRVLHNATLLLALHLTDMHPDDYQVLRFGETQPTVPAHASTSFGQMDVHVDVAGVAKGIDSVVFDRTRAILVADEAVAWVDTEAFKQASVVAARPQADRVGLAEQVSMQSASIAVERGVGADDVVVGLPRALALAGPLFRLRVGDHAPVAPSSNELNGDSIRLRFARVHNWDDDGPAPPLELEVLGAGVKWALTFRGDASGAYSAAPPAR
jgi:hypothetical protein